MKKTGFFLLMIITFISPLFSETAKEREMQKLEMEKALIDAEQHYNQYLSQLYENSSLDEEIITEKSSPINSDGLIIFFIIAAIFVASLIFIGFFWIKQQKIYQGQLSDAVSTMQSQIFEEKNEVEIPFLSKLQKETVADELMVKINNLFSLPPEKTILETDEINKMLLKCRDYGKKIDEYTERNRVSLQVAELVLRVSIRLGYSEEDSTLFYCAALVYDIGFLKLDKDIFLTEHLTDDLFDEMKTHTELGQKMLYFISKKYKPIFLDAISKHHENLDGTGYPNRLINYEIPYIARAIRVAESYLAIVSKRSYKNSMNKNAAFADLRKFNSRYDKKIINALEAII